MHTRFGDLTTDVGYGADAGIAGLSMMDFASRYNHRHYYLQSGPPSQTLTSNMVPSTAPLVHTPSVTPIFAQSLARYLHTCHYRHSFAYET